MFYPHTIKGKPFPRLDLIGSTPATFSTNSANFDGSTTRFDPDNSICSGLSTFSFYTKVKFDVIGQDYLYYESTGLAENSTFVVHMQPDSTILAGYRDSTGGFYNTVFSNVLSTGVWYSIVVTIDVSSAIKIYINNSEHDSRTVATGPIFGGVQIDVPAVGAINVSGVRTNNLDGSMGFMGSNSRVISAAERVNLLTSDCYEDLGTLKTGIINYWDLSNWSGHTGQETTDQAGSNNLTNINSTPFTGIGLTVDCLI